MRRALLVSLIWMVLSVSPATSEPFVTTTSPLRAMAGTEALRFTTPSLRAVGQTRGYKVTTPALRAVEKDNGFRVTTPTLRAVAKAGGYRVTTPTLVAVASTNGLLFSTSPLRAIVETKTDAPEPSPEPDPSGVTCDGLIQCFSQDDIRVVETDLVGLGFTPETDPMFCQNVAQSLGPCDLTSSGGLGTSTNDSINESIPDAFLPDSSPDVRLNRCLPLEHYAIKLQKRADAGENVDAEEATLLRLISRASQHLLLGNSKKWCDEITAGLP